MGRVALVTGGNRGIGLACATGAGRRRLRGRRHVAVGRRRRVHDRALRPDRPGPGRRGHRRGRGAARPRRGAGGQRRDHPRRSRPDDVRRRLRRRARGELVGTFRVVRRCAKPMLRAKWGRIVLIGSVVALSGSGGQVNYARVEGRADRDGASPRPRAREPVDHDERRGARVHRHGHDRRRCPTSARPPSSVRSRSAGWRRPRRWPPSSPSWRATPPATSTAP